MKTLLQSTKALSLRIKELTDSDYPALELPGVLEWSRRVSKLLDNALAADVPDRFVDDLPYLRVQLGHIEDAIIRYLQPVPEPYAMTLPVIRESDSESDSKPIEVLVDFKKMFDHSLIVEAKNLCDRISELLSWRGGDHDIEEPVLTRHPEKLTINDIARSFTDAGGERIGRDRVEQRLRIHGVLPIDESVKRNKEFEFNAVCRAMSSPGHGKVLEFDSNAYHKKRH